MTIREAAEKWVDGFSIIPVSILEKLQMYCNEDEVVEITPPAVGDQVEIIGGGNFEGCTGEIVQIGVDPWGRFVYWIKMDHSGTEYSVGRDDIEVQRDSFFPIWRKLWMFGERIDDEWANGEFLGPHLQEMADCGFRIYMQEDLGLLFGIDGANYDFMKSHFIPLYKARGLRWHTEETEDA